MKPGPPALPTPDVTRALLGAAESVRLLAPWEFMSDLEIIGLRDDATDELHL
jgi:hypothetical protein